MTMNRTQLPRRQFLKTTLSAAGAAIVAPTFIPSTALGLDGAVPPSERVIVGGIGIGNRGTYDLGCFLKQKDVQFAAVCAMRRPRHDGQKPLPLQLRAMTLIPGHCSQTSSAAPRHSRPQSTSRGIARRCRSVARALPSSHRCAPPETGNVAGPVINVEERSYQRWRTRSAAWLILQAISLALLCGVAL